jgi:hypothetical protein
MADNFRTHETNLESPARNAYLVSPNDSVDLPITTRALMVNNPGDVKVEFARDIEGAAVVLKLAASTVYPFCIRRIWANGTTATQITALY